MLPLNQINAPISAVALPALSRLQDQPGRFKKYYLKGVSLISLGTLPLIVFLIIMSQEVTEVLLGSQWKEAGTIFRYLAIAALFQPLCNSTGWIYVSLGRTSRMLRWGVVASTIIVAAFFFGISFKSVGVSIAYSVAIIILVIPCVAFAINDTEINIFDVLSEVASPLLISIVSILVAVILTSFLPKSTSQIIIFTLTLLLMAIIYLILIIKIVMKNFDFKKIFP
jgi:PST family polysaccharide transporter